MTSKCFIFIDVVCGWMFDICLEQSTYMSGTDNLSHKCIIGRALNSDQDLPVSEISVDRKAFEYYNISLYWRHWYFCFVNTYSVKSKNIINKISKNFFTTICPSSYYYIHVQMTSSYFIYIINIYLQTCTHIHSIYKVLFDLTCEPVFFFYYPSQKTIV